MRGVSQISPPIRILVIAVLGLIAAWMLVLRPSADVETPPAKPAATAPGVDGLTNAVDAAKGAAATQEASDAKVQSATGEETGAAAGAKSAPGSAGAKPAAAAAAAKGSLPAPVEKAIADRKVLVLLFWNPKSAEDKDVKKALAGVDRWDGEVFVRATDVKKISRYGTITRGADVDQSPTVVVVDRKLKAERLVGYVDTRAIDQAVVDALRNSGDLIKHRYLRAVNDVCRTYGESVWTIPSPSALGSEVETALDRYQRSSARLLAKFKAVPAPARWRAFKRAGVADLNSVVAINRGLAAKVGDGTSPPAILSALAIYGPRSKKLGARWDARMDKHHVLSCGSNH
jgi:hypothetical protein